MRTRGRGVSKIPKILRTSYVHGPLHDQIDCFRMQMLYSMKHLDDKDLYLS